MTPHHDSKQNQGVGAGCSNRDWKFSCGSLTNETSFYTDSNLGAFLPSYLFEEIMLLEVDVCECQTQTLQAIVNCKKTV